MLDIILKTFRKILIDKDVKKGIIQGLSISNDSLKDICNLIKILYNKKKNS